MPPRLQVPQERETTSAAVDNPQAGEQAEPGVQEPGAVNLNKQQATCDRAGVAESVDGSSSSIGEARNHADADNDTDDGDGEEDDDDDDDEDDGDDDDEDGNEADDDDDDDLKDMEETIEPPELAAAKVKTRNELLPTVSLDLRL